MSKTTAPRVTPQALQENIMSAHYFTADEGVYGHEVLNSESVSTPDPTGPLGRLTICLLVLKNGYVVIGESACVSASIFDAAIGQEVARKDAERKMWPLMGYALKERLSGATTV